MRTMFIVLNFISLLGNRNVPDIQWVENSKKISPTVLHSRVRVTTQPQKRSIEKPKNRPSVVLCLSHIVVHQDCWPTRPPPPDIVIAAYGSIEAIAAGSLFSANAGDFTFSLYVRQLLLCWLRIPITMVTLPCFEVKLLAQMKSSIATIYININVGKIIICDSRIKLPHLRYLLGSSSRIRGTCSRQV